MWELNTWAVNFNFTDHYVMESNLENFSKLQFLHL